MTSRRSRSGGGLVLAAIVALVGSGVLGVAVFAVLLGAGGGGVSCDGAGALPGGSIALGPPGSGQTAGASEYGGPGDPSSGVIGASGANLLREPDSYAELGGYTFQTAHAMGGLPYMTPLRISWGASSAIAYKRDFGFGGGSIDGRARVIDLWWELAGKLGIPYEHGRWSGAVRIERPPAAGAAALLGAAPAVLPMEPAGGSGCGAGVPAGAPLTPGQRAVLLSDGQAAAPREAPVAVKEIIAAGNQIAGRPYVYGGGHGVPLNVISPAYDCSSSIEHLLWGGGVLPSAYGGTSATLESFGAAGPGRWVTLYASPDHVFMYVAGLRWDTHNAAGPGDGSAGIGWHPLVRDAAGFVARHPVGL